jgi:hypothetical protein
LQRLDQLGKQGKSEHIIDRLAKDARKLAKLHHDLQTQIRTARSFTKSYCRDYHIRGERKAKEAIENFSNIDNRIDDLDQTVRDLLQVVSRMYLLFWSYLT